MFTRAYPTPVPPSFLMPSSLLPTGSYSLIPHSSPSRPLPIPPNLTIFLSPFLIIPPTHPPSYRPGYYPPLLITQLAPRPLAELPTTMLAPRPQLSNLDSCTPQRISCVETSVMAPAACLESGRMVPGSWTCVRHTWRWPKRSSRAVQQEELRREMGRGGQAGGRRVVGVF